MKYNLLFGFTPNFRIQIMRKRNVNTALKRRLRFTTPACMAGVIFQEHLSRLLSLLRATLTHFCILLLTYEKPLGNDNLLTVVCRDYFDVMPNS